MDVVKSASLKPGLAGALSGVWELTWRAQLTWKKAPAMLTNILTVPLLSYLSLGMDDPLRSFQTWTVDFYLFLVLPIICLTAFGGMVRDDLQEDTVGFLLTRPLKRSRFFLCKYMSHMLWAQITGVLTLAAFGVVGVLKSLPDLVSMLTTLLTVQILAILAYGAVSSLFGLLTRKFLVLGLIYGFIVEFGIAQIPTNINTLAMSKHLRVLLAGHESLAGGLGLEAGNPLLAGVALLGAAALFLAAGAALFTVREYHHTEDMQK